MKLVNYYQLIYSSEVYDKNCFTNRTIAPYNFNASKLETNAYDIPFYFRLLRELEADKRSSK